MSPFAGFPTHVPIGTSCNLAASVAVGNSSGSRCHPLLHLGIACVHRAFGFTLLPHRVRRTTTVRGDVMRQFFRPLIVTSVATAVMLGLVGSAGASAGFDPIGHRGYTARWTENTLPAIRAAIRHGASAVELDVRLSRSGKMVLMHERSVARTTTGSGYVDRLSSTRIAELRTPDGAHVPSVNRTLGVFSRLDARPVLEIKAGPSAGWNGRQIRKLRRVLVRHQLFDRALVISFNDDLVQRVERVAPRIATSWIRRQGVDNVSLSAGAVGPKRVRRLKRSGIGFFGRNSDRAWEWRRFERAGVVGVVTDRIPAYVRWDRTK